MKSGVIDPGILESRRRTSSSPGAGSKFRSSLLRLSIYAMSSCGESDADAGLTTVTKTRSFSTKSSGCKGLRTPFSYTASTCILMAPLYAFHSGAGDGSVVMVSIPYQLTHSCADHLQTLFRASFQRRPSPHALSWNTEIAPLAAPRRRAPLTFRHSGGMTDGRPLVPTGSKCRLNHMPQMQGVGYSARQSNGLGISPFKIAVSSMHGTVVNFVNMETSQINKDGNFANFFRSNLLGPLRAPFLRSFLGR